MRKLTAPLVVGTALVAGGCAPWMHRGGGSVAENAPVNEPAPSVKEMVDYLNACSARVASVKSDGLDMDCKARGESIGLIANMVCQKPKNFRLRGKIAGQPACDIGSNNEEFWYWITKDEPAGVRYCSYESMAKGSVRLPFPFQPDLVVAALGMGDYDPDPSKYELKVVRNTLELSENAVSPQGQPVRKVTVFSRAKMSEVELQKGRPQVIGYALRDAQGRDLCKAVVERVSVEKGAVVPRKVRLSWPAERMELALTLNTVYVNTVDPQLAQMAFSRRDLASFPTFDLARGFPPAGSTSIQRVRGSMR
jgi:hypothetical protein